jgi:hypothetical protein
LESKFDASECTGLATHVSDEKEKKLKKALVVILND